MKEAARKQRNTDRLTELHPRFRKQLMAVIETLENIGYRPRIQDAWRSPEDQLKAYKSGHSKLKYGFHNVTSDAGLPEALAVDLLDDDSPLSPSKAYLLHLAAAAEAKGLTTGIRWGLPAKLRSGIDLAIANAEWKASVKIGWDPTHVEVTGISVAEARAGRRPTLA